MGLIQLTSTTAAACPIVVLSSDPPPSVNADSPVFMVDITLGYIVWGYGSLSTGKKYQNQINICPPATSLQALFTNKRHS